MEKLKFDQEESFLLSDGESSINTDLAIRRRTAYRTDDENMITRRKYFVEGKRITVNSVFNMHSLRTEHSFRFFLAFQILV